MKAKRKTAAKGTKKAKSSKDEEVERQIGLTLYENWGKVTVYIGPLERVSAALDVIQGILSGMGSEGNLEAEVCEDVVNRERDRLCKLIDEGRQDRMAMIQELTGLSEKAILKAADGFGYMV